MAELHPEVWLVTAGTKYRSAEKGAAIRSIVASWTNGYSQWDAYVAS